MSSLVFHRVSGAINEINSSLSSSPAAPAHGWRNALQVAEWIEAVIELKSTPQDKLPRYLCLFDGIRTEFALLGNLRFFDTVPDSTLLQKAEGTAGTLRKLINGQPATQDEYTDALHCLSAWRQQISLWEGMKMFF